MLAKPSQTQSLILFESTERRQRIKHVIFVMKEFSIYARRPRERDGSGSSMSSTS